jgi:hypothetical protein
METNTKITKIRRKDMRHRYFVFALVTCFLFTGCGKVEQELLLDSFEGVLNSKTVDFGASDGSSLHIEAENALKKCAEQSLKLSYNLKPSGYMWVARGFNLDVKGAAQWLVEPEKIKWKKYNAISFSMYGSESGGMLAFDVKDAGGEIWRFLVDGNFAGWKEITCPFSKFFVRHDWQPETAEKNGTLDFPIMSFQFEPRHPGKATYYFDCVRLTKK